MKLIEHTINSDENLINFNEKFNSFYTSINEKVNSYSKKINDFKDSISLTEKETFNDNIVLNGFSLLETGINNILNEKYGMKLLVVHIIIIKIIQKK